MHSHQQEKKEVLLKAVLILVLMEDALARKKPLNKATDPRVLILVLMEDALAQTSLSLIGDILVVLILVLMEDALALQVFWMLVKVLIKS